MPTPPRYDSPQIQRQGTPNVRVTQSAPVEAFGGGRVAEGVSRPLNQIAQDTFQIAQKEKAKADDVAVQDAYTRTVQMKNTLFFDPKNGAVTKGGKDAFGVIDEYGTQYDKEADEIENSLTNEDQRQQYRVIRARQKADFDNDLNKHVYSQAKRYEDETFKSTLSTSRDDAILHYNDPTKIQESVELQKAVIIDYAQKNNMPPEWVKQAITESNSKTHSEIINRMLANGDDPGAEKHFKEHKDQIGGEYSADIEKNLEEGSMRGNSQRAADTIVAKHNDMGSALKAAKDIENPKLRDETERRIKDHFQTMKAAENDRKDAIFDSVSRKIETTKSRDSIPPAQWNAMDLQQRNAIDNRIKQLKEGVPPVTDRKTYLELTDMVENDRKKFLNTNLMLYTSNLSDSDFKKFADMQADAKKGGGQKIDGFMSDQQVVNGVLKQMKISKNSDSADKFRKMLDTRVIQYEKDTGKKADNDVLRKLSNELAIQGITDKGLLWDTKKYSFQLNADESFEDIVVPESDRAEIESELRKRGKPVTEQSVKSLYIRGNSGQ